MSTTSRRNRAFTLIELLVVISIMVLLISLLLPALSSARRTAQTVICLNVTRQSVTIQNLYINDYKDYLLHQQHKPRAQDGSFPGNFSYFLGFPMAHYGMNFRNDDNSYRDSKGIRCPGETRPRRVALEYGTDYNVNQTFGYWGSNSLNGNYVTKPLKASLLLEPGTTPWLWDCLNIEDRPNTNQLLRTTTGTKVMAFRHQGQVGNIVFMDGHAISAKESTMYRMYNTAEGNYVFTQDVTPRP